MQTDTCSDGHPADAIVYWHHQHMNNLHLVLRRVETVAPEMTTAHGGDGFHIRTIGLSALNTQELAQSVHLIRAGAPT
jgi:hypothetical protein